jgi:hypothetical protein
MIRAALLASTLALATPAYAEVPSEGCGIACIGQAIEAAIALVTPVDAFGTVPPDYWSLTWTIRDGWSPIGPVFSSKESCLERAARFEIENGVTTRCDRVALPFLN